MFGCACRLVFFFFLTMVRSPICKWNVWVRAVTFFRVWSPKNIKQWVPKTVRTFVVLPHLTMWCPAVTAWFSWTPDAWSNLGHLAGWSPTAGDISAVKLEYIHISVIFSSMVINQESIFHPYFRISSHINIRRIFSVWDYYGQSHMNSLFRYFFPLSSLERNQVQSSSQGSSADDPPGGSTLDTTHDWEW